ncbi:hypothetical protein D3C75_1098470 [compost metagenome]
MLLERHDHQRQCVLPFLAQRAIAAVVEQKVIQVDSLPEPLGIDFVLIEAYPGLVDHQDIARAISQGGWIRIQCLQCSEHCRP